MAEHLFHIRLSEIISGRIDALKEEMAIGACEDFADYRKRQGRIEGLVEALGHSQDVQKKLLGGDVR